MSKSEPTGGPTSEKGTAPPVLKEAVALPGVGLSIPLRAAKAKLSALLELVPGNMKNLPAHN